MASTQSPVAKAITSCRAQTCLFYSGEWLRLGGSGREKLQLSFTNGFQSALGGGKKKRNVFHVCRNQLHLQMDQLLFWIQVVKTTAKVAFNSHGFIYIYIHTDQKEEKQKGPPTFSPIILPPPVSRALYTS